ncbi:MAG: hypothetical protein HOW73_29585 [Polyangiaceae bacterium]|nr:hypothetical protein [Polyangiaceae bacterium]
MKTQAAIALTLVLIGACGDDSATASGGAGGGGAPAGGSDNGGDGGGLAGAPSGGAGGAAHGGGGTGGAPAGCSPYDPASCDGGTTCVVVDDALGLEGGTACAASGAAPVYSVCAADADCAAGTLCDRVMKTCKPVCDENADCPDDASCFPAQTAAGEVIPGLKLCIAGCDPVSNTPCDASGGAVNCVHRPAQMAFDCAPAGEKMEGAACEEHLECTTDFGCLAVNGTSGCLHWCVYDGGTDICTPEEHPDAQFALCVPQSPTISVDGVVYGGCLKQL